MGKVKKGIKIAEVVGAAVALVKDNEIQKLLFGTYSDGSARGISDCINGEILSPKDKEKYVYKKKKKKKKKINL